VSRDHVQIGADQNRDVEPKALNAPGDLPDLLLAVDPGVPRVWFELVDGNILDGELSASAWWEGRRECHLAYHLALRLRVPGRESPDARKSRTFGNSTCLNEQLCVHFVYFPEPLGRPLRRW
jgi:hypothetical protein